MGGHHHIEIGAVAVLLQGLADHLAQVVAVGQLDGAGLDALLIAPGCPALDHGQALDALQALAVTLGRHQHAVHIVDHALAVAQGLPGLLRLGPAGAVRVLEVHLALEQGRQQLLHGHGLVAQLHPAMGSEQVEQLAGKALVLALGVDAVVRGESQFLHADHIAFGEAGAGKHQGEQTAGAWKLHGNPPGE